MNPFDIVIAVILIFCLVRGIFRGLIKELSSIVGVLAGFYAAYSYYPDLGHVLAKWISSPAYLNILSFMLIFFGVFISIGILGVIIKYLLSIAFLGWVDRLCGAGFGVLKGILISSVILLVLATFLPKGAPIIKESILAPRVMLVSETMAQVIPIEMKREFSKKITTLKKSWRIPIR